MLSLSESLNMNSMKLLEYVNQGRGRRSAIARAIGVPAILISQWAYARRQVPADRCPDIERATSGAVRCEDMRSDVDWSVLRRSAPSRKEAAHV